MQFRLTRLAVLALVVSVGAAACGKYSISNIRSLKAFQDANSLYAKKDYAAAVQRYEDSIRFNPDLGFAYFFLGNSYDFMYKPARKGDPENDANLPKAAENYRIAIEKLRNSEDPKELEIRKLSYEYLIAVYGTDKLADFAKAEQVAKELIAIEADNPANHQMLARLYQDQGRFEEAEAEFRRAIDIRPNDPLGYQLLAVFYNTQAEFDKTMEAWQQRAEHEPNNPEAWHTIGHYYYEKVFRDKSVPRAKAIEYTQKGLDAEERALAINSEYLEALVMKNVLMRIQANFERDPAKQKQLIDEADVLLKKAEEIRKKQNQGGGTDTGKKGGGSQ
jgi:tetratricopeptide (TPR) repeat protein